MEQMNIYTQENASDIINLMYEALLKGTIKEILANYAEQMLGVDGFYDPTATHLGIDEDGAIWGYSTEPEKLSAGWAVPNEHRKHIQQWAMNTQPPEDWTQELFKIPESAAYITRDDYGAIEAWQCDAPPQPKDGNDGMTEWQPTGDYIRRFVGSSTPGDPFVLMRYDIVANQETIKEYANGNV